MSPEEREFGVETGFGNGVAQPDLRTLRRLPWTLPTAHVMADVSQGRASRRQPRAKLSSTCWARRTRWTTGRCWAASWSSTSSGRTQSPYEPSRQGLTQTSWLQRGMGGKSPRTLETYRWPVYKLLLPASEREGIHSATKIRQRFLDRVNAEPLDAGPSPASVPLVPSAA